MHEAYVALNMAQSLHPEARQAHLVFTPLHGTNTTVGAVLRRAGFQVDLVAAQAVPDGAFPAVPYRAPNPEVPESMQQGMELAREVGADAVFACDPDADRLGVCSRTADGTFRFLTGNEIAALTTHYKLEQLKNLGRIPATLVIKTEVTTELLRPITDVRRRARGGFTGRFQVPRQRAGPSRASRSLWGIAGDSAGFCHCR